MAKATPEGNWVPINLETVPKKIKDAVLTNLLSRSGFDSTWDSIDDDIKTDIHNELTAIIREVLEYSNG